MKKALFAILVLSAFANTQAQAGTFGFAADEPFTSNQYFISQGYQGFDYGGGDGASSWVSDSVLPIDSSYNVNTSPLGAAWSNGGTALTLTDATPGGLFDFGSVSLDVGHNESVTLDGLVNGIVVDSWTGQINNQAAYTNLTLNWSNINEVTFSQGANLFVTNIDTQNAPEPASLALFGAGLISLAVLRKKKRA